MNIRRFALGEGKCSTHALSSIVFTAGFTTAVILPFYLYLFGAGIFWEFLGIAICTLVVWGVESYPLMRYTRKSGKILTLPGYYEYRFKSRGGLLRLFASVEIIVISVVLAALFVKELSIILGVIFDIETNKCMAIVLILLSGLLGYFGINLIYKTAWAKAVILVFGISFILFYMVSTLGAEGLMKNLMSSDITGSVSRYLNVLYHNGKLLEPEDFVSLISMGLLASGMPFMLGIFFAQKGPKSINKGRRVIIIFSIILFEAAFFMGAVSRGYLYPEKLTNSLSRYFYLLFTKLYNESGTGRFASFILILVIVIGFVTAIEGAMHVVITSIYEDIITCGKLIKVNPKKSRRDLIIISFIVGLTVLLVGAYIEQMSISVIITFIATLGCSVSPTVFLSLVWKRMNSAGCMAGLVGGLLAVPFFKFTPFLMLGGERVSLCDMLGINSVIPSMITTILFVVFVSLITEKPDEKIEKEFREIKSRISE